MTGTTIRRGDVMKSRSGELQNRHDGTFAWKTAVAAGLNLPGLRGLWTMGSFDENGDQYDLSGQGRTLSYNGNPTYSNDGLIPYLALDGTGDYLNRADEAGLDILGTETYIAAAQRGLTLGGWFRFDRLTAAEFLISKGTVITATSSYWLLFRGDIAGDPIRFQVSDGAAVDTVDLNLTTAPTTATWTFVCGRYDPSTEIKVWASQGTLESNTNAVGIPAALNNSGADFTIGAPSGAAGNLLDGQVGLCFLSTMLLSNTIVSAFYHHTRALYGI